jgi:hypothetical protein
VNEGLPRSVLVNPFVDPEVEGLVQIAVGLGGNERTVLRPKVGAGYESDCNLVAHNLVNLFQIGETDLALALKDFIYVIATRCRADVPLLHVADSFGVFHPGTRDQSNVTEPSAAKVRQNSFIRRGVKPLGLTLEVLQILI